MFSSSRLGALSAIAAGVAGMAWFVFELAPVNMGFDDTDDPSVSLRYLHLHADLYAQAGVALILMGVALAVAVFAVSDAIAPRADRLALRSVTAFGVASRAVRSGVARAGLPPAPATDGRPRLRARRSGGRPAGWPVRRRPRERLGATIGRA